MGLFGKLFSVNKTQDSGMEHSMEQQSSASTATMAKDPVCGMDVDPNKAAAKSEYQGKTFYFCAPACKAEFLKDPAKYTSGQMAGGHSQKHSCC